MSERPTERTYGLFRKTPEDKSLCIEAIHGGGKRAISHQCNRKRGYGPTGEYCKIHCPEEVEKRRKEMEDRWNRKREGMNAPYKKIEEQAREIEALRKRVNIALDIVEDYRRLKDITADEDSAIIEANLKMFDIGYKATKEPKASPPSRSRKRGESSGRRVMGRGNKI